MTDLIGHLLCPTRPRPGIFQQQTPCCHQTTWGLPLIIQQAVRPPALDIIDLLYIRRPHLYGLFQCNALPLCIPPSSGFKIRLIFCCCIQLSAVENKVTTANFVSEVIKHLSAIIGNVCNHRTKCQCLQIIASPKASVTYGCYFGESDAFKYITNIDFIFYNFRNISLN